jgi:integrase
MQRGFARKRGTTWTAYYYVTDATGRHQRSKGGFKTKAAATAHLNTVLADLQRGTHVETSDLTLEEYLVDRWLPVVRYSIQPSTWDSYQRILTNHVLPELGRLPLQRLTVHHFDQLYAQLLSDGAMRREGGLAPKTVRYIHNTLHKALRDAERKGLIARNPTDAADAPKLKRNGGKEMKTWRPCDVRTFLEGVKHHRLYAAYLLAVTTGMRRGEILGLRWADVDLEAQRVAVRQTIVPVNYELVVGEPKTPRSRRLISVDGMTATALHAHRRRQAAEKLVFGVGYHDQDLVFAREDGRPTHPDYFSQTFDRSVARLKLPRIRLHDLRHTHATLGLASGIPAKIISERLGHANVAFTQDVYMHALPEFDQRAASQIARLIFASTT